MAAGQSVTESFAYTASDGLANTPGALTITVTGKNDAPTLEAPLADQAGQAGTPVSLMIPGTTFADIDEGDVLTLSAQLANGDSLPDWLSFNPITGRLFGTPGASNTGDFQIRVTATDTGGLSASDVFNLTITDAGGFGSGNPPGVGTPGFWKQWTVVWDGNTSNDYKFNNKANFAKADILYTVTDPVTGGHACKGILVGDWNGNGITDGSERTLFYSLTEAKTLLSASDGGQDSRYILGKHLVATWLNVMAGNNADKIQTDINNAIEWLQHHSPNEGGSSLGDGNLTINAAAFKVPASSLAWQIVANPDLAHSGSYNGEAIKNVLDYYNNTGAGFAIDRDSNHIQGDLLTLLGLQSYQQEFHS